MRVKIKDSKAFFDEVKGNKSLRSFCKENNLVYSTIKKWRRGEYTMDKKIFDSLLYKSKHKTYWTKKITISADNWGQSLAGKISAIKLGKIGVQKRLEKARKMRKIGNNYRKFNLSLGKNFCEFYGALMGDGCISIYKRTDGYNAYDIVISGHRIRDRWYHLYLKELIEREFKIKTWITEIKKTNARRIIIKSKGLVTSLRKIGFPKGKKGKRLKIPQRLIELDWDMKKNIIRGIFDTDGSILAKRHEKYRYPYIIITSISDKLLLQLYKTLKSQEYPFYIRKATSTHAGEILMRGNKNIKRWMKDIGSNNQKHTIKYEYWLKNGFLPVKLLDKMGL